MSNSLEGQEQVSRRPGESVKVQEETDWKLLEQLKRMSSDVAAVLQIKTKLIVPALQIKVDLNVLAS